MIFKHRKREMTRKTFSFMALVMLPAFVPALSSAETVSILIPTNAAPRVEFGAEKLVEALKAVKLEGTIFRVEPKAIFTINPQPGPKIRINPSAHIGSVIVPWGATESRVASLRRGISERESFALTPAKADGFPIVTGADDSGKLYGCLELAKRIRKTGKVPVGLRFTDRPAMTLRGTCVGLQKTTILPGRKVYEYPYTPELFPWFYDKELWVEYLDFLVEHRFNALFLWNGHPFGSLVRLPDYPEAVEVSPDVFEKNVEMFRWLATECDRRGIWLVQMFYNILLPKPLADKHGIPTQLAAPTPLASDYTRKAIAEFLRQYPNVGLMVCLGEALQGTENQINWATNTILPGVLDGMKAAGLKEQPPVVIRTHAMNPEAVIPECFKVYTNLYTETKFNGESLTTYEVRGKVQATHLTMAKLGPHIINVHILSNLEPFRYGAQRFIRKCMQAARDRLGASGLHLYPLSYWNWPYSPDIVDGTARLTGGDNPPRQASVGLLARQDRQVARSTPLKQWDRDWVWFEAWGRYAWNPDIPEPEDRTYWIGRLSDFYGCDTNTAVKILDAYNDAGEVAPMLIRRFGITEGNRQTLSLGMTLDQLVNPNRYNAIRDLWESLAPPGERLDEYVRKEWNKEPHIGETPGSVIADCLRFSSNAVALLAQASLHVTQNRDEFNRLSNDLQCIHLMAHHYGAKARAAELVLMHSYSKDIAHMEMAERALAESVEWFAKLTELTKDKYHFANSLQTGHRKIPFPCVVGGVVTNYHWTHVLPLYERELADFRMRVAELNETKTGTEKTIAQVAAWPAAKLTLISTNAETYEVKIGARPFMDRQYVITGLAQELTGLTGIRFSHEAAKNGRYTPVEFEVSEPVFMLIGFFNERREIWLQVPNPDEAADASERGWVEPVLLNAATIEGCPSVNVHAVRYGVGRHRLEVPGKGSFVVLGVVPQMVKLERRDAGLR